MNAETKTPMATTEREPTSALTTVPMWLFIVMLLVLFGSAVYFDARGGWFEPKVYGPYVSLEQVGRFQPKATGEWDPARGEYVFNSICALCHGPDGGGKPGQGPPLASSEWVITEGANRIIRIPLVGLTGPIKVMGQDYNLSMPAVNTLSDEDIANVLSYIRQAWGNKAPPVKPEQVAAVRAEVKNRSQLYTGDELMGLSEK